MTGLYIALAFIGIIVFILTSSLSVAFNITDKVYFKVSFLGLCIFDINSKKKHKKQSKEKSNIEKKQFTSVLKEYASNKNNKELIFELLSLIKELCVKCSKLLKHVNVKRLEFNLKIASDDAAKTAILYGNACSIVYSIVALLKSACDFDHKKIMVSADFSSEQISLKLLCQIKIKLIYVITFAVSVLYSLIKIKLGEIKNGRSQH